MRGAQTSQPNRRLKRNQKDTEALDQYLEEEKLELDALSLEAKLLLGPTKKVRDNNHIIGTCQYLFDFSFKDQTLQVMQEEVQPNSPRTEILSCEGEMRSELENELDELSGDVNLLPGILIEEDSKDLETTRNSLIKKEEDSPDIIFDDDGFNMKEEFIFEDFPLKNNGRDVQFIKTSSIDEEDEGIKII